VKFRISRFIPSSRTTQAVLVSFRDFLLVGGIAIARVEDGPHAVVGDSACAAEQMGRATASKPSAENERTSSIDRIAGKQRQTPDALSGGRKMAFIIAAGGNPGSSIPGGPASLGATCSSIRGISSMRGQVNLLNSPPSRARSES
jgi:hypothetical protein